MQTTGRAVEHLMSLTLKSHLNGTIHRMQRSRRGPCKNNGGQGGQYRDGEPGDPGSTGRPGPRGMAANLGNVDMAM